MMQGPAIVDVYDDHGRPDMVGLSSRWYQYGDRSMEYDIRTDRGASGLVRNELPRILQGARDPQMCRPLADPAVTASLEADLWTPREGADGQTWR